MALLALFWLLQALSLAEMRRPQDPVSHFLMELGNVFLDVDGAIAVQSAPKVRHEARPQQFHRIQAHYRGIQDQLATFIARSLAPSPLLDGAWLPDVGRRRGDVDQRSSTSPDVDQPSDTRPDLYFRQLLQNQGRWLLENPLLRALRERATTTTPSPSDLDKTYYSLAGEGKAAREEVSIVLEAKAAEGVGDTLLLAFTEDGVPLKLRMGPEIEQPVRHLQRILRAAGVSLKLPVRSRDDPEPVGREVLLLGSGAVARAVYLDLSNPDQLRSLLNTLTHS